MKDKVVSTNQVSKKTAKQTGNGSKKVSETQDKNETVPLNSPIPRRNFLAKAAAGAAGITALSAGVIEVTSSKSAAQTPQRSSAMSNSTKAKHQWCMVLDLRYCNGCKACTAACQQAHYLHADQTWIDVFTMKNASGNTYYMPRPCMMCEDPPCVPVCPVSANFRTEEGLTLVDQNRCIGTRICMNVCPYQARYFNWVDPKPAPHLPFPRSPEWPTPQIKGTVGKCVFCAAMLPMGKVPECVSGCPMGVIYMGDLVSDVAVNSFGQTIQLSKFLEDNDAVKFKESYGTHPRVFYIPGHDQLLDSDQEG
ncbi:MAG: 4Fe-4S dicluster domain-containing protein [Actinobacteria bacterium]|nr:4Fe-4S dicluster domain-containing protein [Actinomycetota bacterium]MCL6105216.1 4Fe-4S dicluster domain-containing protein [Actinomycetota bacterium]